MPFPEATRVLYKKNPLQQVICQLQFPPILKIDAQIPAEFQDRVRKEFPNYSEVIAEPPSEIKGQIPSELFSKILKATSSNKNYAFSSENENWRVNLTRTFIAITATKYERWEHFKSKLDIPLKALIDVYAPIHFSRIGLRYIDIFNRSDLGFEANTSWTELLKPDILGILGSTEVSDFVKASRCTYQIGLSDGESTVRLVAHLVEDDGEICYAIDSDFSNHKKMPIKDATGKLDYFNKRATRLIRWCITDRLHNSMEPQNL